MTIYQTTIISFQTFIYENEPKGDVAMETPDIMSSIPPTRGETALKENIDIHCNI